MEFTDLVNKRLEELTVITNYISKQEENFKPEIEGLIEKIKNSGDTDEDYQENIKRIKEIKKINSFAMLRVNEVGINVRVMNELYSLMKILGAEVNLPESDLSNLEFNLTSIKPVYVKDKSGVAFYNSEVEEFITKQIDTTDEKFDEIIKNIKG